MNPAPAATAADRVALRARGSPCLWFTRLPLDELVDLLRERHFPRIRQRVKVQFAAQERLVEFDPVEGALGAGRAITLSFHEVLNQAATPVEVFGALAKRAFARIDRRDALRAPFGALCPEEGFADAWIEHFLGNCLRRQTSAGGDAPGITNRWRELGLRPRPLPPLLRLELARADAALLRHLA